MNYSFPRENIPESYQKVSWQDIRERCPNDYGPPERPYTSPYPPGDELDTIAEWERMKLEDVTNDLLITY